MKLQTLVVVLGMALMPPALAKASGLHHTAPGYRVVEVKRDECRRLGGRFDAAKDTSAEGPCLVPIAAPTTPIGGDKPKRKSTERTNAIRSSINGNSDALGSVETDVRVNRASQTQSGLLNKLRIRLLDIVLDASDWVEPLNQAISKIVHTVDFGE